MKKLLSTAIALMMILSLSVTAFAEEIIPNTDPRTSETEITVSILPTYTVTIPANTEIVFNEASTDLGKITLDKAQIAPNHAVRVSASTGEFANAADNTKTIPYKLMDGQDEFTSAEYTKAGDNTALTIAITQDAWNTAYAGDYSGTITFTVEYIAQNVD